MGPEDFTRRTAMTLVAAAVAGPAFAQPQRGPEQEISATEDLMREHGILRRILIVYSEVPAMLRRPQARFDASAIGDAAVLFRDFGENYHERRLEEERVFPDVVRYGGAAARLVPVLLRQHGRGRDITRYILDATKGGRLGDGEALARAMESMARMYQPHAAWEDTLLFPAWKERHTQVQLDDVSEEFEDIEKRMFGTDGFDDAVERIGRIEARLGLGNLDRYTAPPPPRAG